jgi:pimeloyl-ACP methyl ester carboxylesterase
LPGRAGSYPVRGGSGWRKSKYPIFLWQGEADVVVTPAMGRFMADRIPNCTARFVPGEGYRLFVNYWREILGQLTAGA